MGTELSRPLPPLPDRTASPTPPPVSSEQPGAVRSCLPPRIAPPTLPPDISTYPTRIPFQITHYVVPDNFSYAKPLLPYPSDQPSANADPGDYMDDDDDMDAPPTPNSPRTTIISIQETALHRFILQQALLGFTSHMSLSLMWMLDGGDEQGYTAINHKMQMFEQKLLSVSLFWISRMVRDCWGFVVMLEPSGTHGAGGVQARVEAWWGGKFWSLFVMGVGREERDLERFGRVMEGLCRGVWVKCVGVLWRGMGCGGEVGSRVVGFVWRKVAACGGFVTMSSVGGLGVRGLGPRDVGGMQEGEFGGMVERFGDKFRAWGGEAAVERVWREWRELKEGGVAGAGEGGKDRAEFERAWGKVEGFDTLKTLLGGVGCVALEGGTASEEGVGVSGWGDGRDADFVLHCKQFVRLKGRMGAES